MSLCRTADRDLIGYRRPRKALRWTRKHRGKSLQATRTRFLCRPVSCSRSAIGAVTIRALTTLARPGRLRFGGTQNVEASMSASSVSVL